MQSQAQHTLCSQQLPLKLQRVITTSCSGLLAGQLRKQAILIPRVPGGGSQLLAVGRSLEEVPTPLLGYMDDSDPKLGFECVTQGSRPTHRLLCPVPFLQSLALGQEKRRRKEEEEEEEGEEEEEEEEEEKKKKRRRHAKQGRDSNGITLPLFQPACCLGSMTSSSAYSSLEVPVTQE
ncbi:hypothetical protein TREES_T100014586 [Tupaia chinensis]|uniref:Uncharacterized protein n=1 Tax=Tupaia chinensis TaxID=246437 RepID=L9L1V7_TUPCH|nr:hypothetical protein TREES_T100014586 [Tupaia chinensis]